MHVGRAVGEEDAGAGVGQHHHALGQVAPRVVHGLVRGRDVARGGEVVGAEVRADAAALARGEEAGQRRAAVGAEQRLRRPRSSAPAAACPPPGRGARSSISNSRTSVRGCSATVTLGSVTTKLSGRRPPVSAEQRVEEELERARAARLPLLAERLDADADERRQRALAACRARPRARRRRGRVLLGVGARAEAVLEVDAEVLDRLALELARARARRR